MKNFKKQNKIAKKNQDYLAKHKVFIVINNIQTNYT